VNHDVFVQDNFELESEATVADLLIEQSADRQSDLWALAMAILSTLLIICLARSVDAFPHWMSVQVSPLFANVGPHFHQ
jgi:hypothetical protein